VNIIKYRLRQAVLRELPSVLGDLPAVRHTRFSTIVSQLALLQFHLLLQASLVVLRLGDSVSISSPEVLRLEADASNIRFPLSRVYISRIAISNCTYVAVCCVYPFSSAYYGLL
jgi:hypothetical protein